jgi:5-methylcytosine-specific restriction endonuclease McrA
MFHGDFFSDEDELSTEEVQALLLEREDRRARRVRHAVALMQRQSPTAPDPSREAIPVVVMRAVWRRDGGRCVRCGGHERLEFDHVIPVSLGGATSARNLQLLCEGCNRRKGASLG